jgi:hypothetical protein
MILSKTISVNDDAVMNSIASAFFKSIEATNLLPFLNVESWQARLLDNGYPVFGFESSIIITGSLDPEKNWRDNILYNSRYFSFSVEPESGFIFKEGMNITLELDSKSFRIEKSSDFPKYTGTPDEAIRLLISWIESAN